jgi:hypothetical protein
MWVNSDTFSKTVGLSFAAEDVSSTANSCMIIWFAPSRSFLSKKFWKDVQVPYLIMELISIEPVDNFLRSKQVVTNETQPFPCSWTYLILQKNLKVSIFL